MIGGLGQSANQILIKIKGDDKDFQGALKKSERGMDGFTSKMKAAGPMIGAAFAAAAVGMVAMSVKMAAAEEVVTRQTEALLKAQGIMWGSVKGEVTDYINELEALTAYNDTDLQMAFNAMIAAGMSYTEAMESMNTVTAMAYSLNRDLGSMALLVGKAYNGQTGELSRYGIVLDETLDKTEKFAGLQKHVADNFADASDRTDTLEGKMKIMKNTVDDTAEAFGNELIPQLTYYLDAVIEASGGTEQLGKALGEALTFPGDVIKDLGEIAAVTSEAYKISKAGLKTEEEISDVLSLEFETIMDMTEQEVRLKTETLERLGHEKEANQFRAYYAYTLKQEEIALDRINQLKAEGLVIDVASTAEGEKQLSTMRERATEAQRSISVRKEGSSGTSSMSAATAALYKEHYSIDVSPGRINPNITGGNNSGV